MLYNRPPKKIRGDNYQRQRGTSRNKKRVDPPNRSEPKSVCTKLQSCRRSEANADGNRQTHNKAGDFDISLPATYKKLGGKSANIYTNSTTYQSVGSDSFLEHSTQTPSLHALTEHIPRQTISWAIKHISTN